MKIRATIALASLLFAAPAAARPAPVRFTDYCLTFPGFNYTLIGKGFSVPARGQCRGWIGFSPLGGFDAPSIGTGCLSSDGRKLSFTITTMFDYVTLFDNANLNMPMQTGDAEEQGIEIGLTFPPAGAGVSGAACNASANRIPPNIATQNAERPHLNGIR